MCNLQSNLKLNERGRAKERRGGSRRRKKERRNADEGRDAAHTERMRAKVERALSLSLPASILSTHGIPPGSLQDLFSHCLQKCGERREGRGRKERQHNAREDRETLSGPLHPFADAFRSHRNLGSFSLFLASRACENSTVQDAIGVRRVVEDVQETLYRANYLRLTTLPARTAEFLLPTHLPADSSR